MPGPKNKKLIPSNPPPVWLDPTDPINALNVQREHFMQTNFPGPWNERAKLIQSIEFSKKLREEKQAAELKKNTFKINDPRKIRATTGQAIRPNSDLVTGYYNPEKMTDIIGWSKTYNVDPFTALAIGLSETQLGKKDPHNIGHVLNAVTRGDSPEEDLVKAFRNKMDYAKKLGKKTEESQLQAYQGYNYIYPETEQDYHGFKMSKIFGVPIPKEGLDMNKLNLKGIDLIDLRENVLKKNPAVVDLVNRTERIPIAFPGLANYYQGDAEDWKSGGRITKKGKKRRKYGPRPKYMNQNPSGMTTGPITQRSIGNTPGGGYMSFGPGGKTFLEPNDPKLPMGYEIPFRTPSSEQAMSIGGGDQPAYLIPSFKYGRKLSGEQAYEEYLKTGEHLGGPFKTWQEADEWDRTVRHPYVEKGQAIPTPYRRWGKEYAKGGWTYPTNTAYPMYVDGGITEDQPVTTINLPEVVIEGGPPTRVEAQNELARLQKPDQNYAIIEKNINRIYYYNPKGQLIKSEPIITGKSNNDIDQGLSMKEWFEKTGSESHEDYFKYLEKNKYQTTPSGIYNISGYRTETATDPSLVGRTINLFRPERAKQIYDSRVRDYGEQQKMFTLKSEYGIGSSKAIHGTANPERVKALETSGANKNLSNGCVNVNGQTVCFDTLGKGSNVYILPEQSSNLLYHKKSLNRIRNANILGTKNKIKESLEKNNIPYNSESLAFLTAVAEKETKGGRSLRAKLEDFLPNKLANSKGTFQINPYTFSKFLPEEYTGDFDSQVIAVNNFYNTQKQDNSPSQLYQKYSGDTKGKYSEKFNSLYDTALNVYKQGGSVTWSIVEDKPMAKGGWTGYPDHTMYSSGMERFDRVRKYTKYADGGTVVLVESPELLNSNSKTASSENPFMQEAKDLQKYIIATNPKENVQIIPYYYDPKNPNQLSEYLKNSDKDTNLAFFAHSGDKLFGMPTEQFGNTLQRVVYKDCYAGTCNFEKYASKPEFKKLQNFHYRPDYQWFGVNPNPGKSPGQQSIDYAMYSTVRNQDQENRYKKELETRSKTFEDTWKDRKFVPGTSTEDYVGNETPEYKKALAEFTKEMSNIANRLHYTSSKIGTPVMGVDYKVSNSSRVEKKTGGNVQPYIISDPEEFKRANKAYQDSSELYNFYNTLNRRIEKSGLYLPTPEYSKPFYTPDKSGYKKSVAPEYIGNPNTYIQWHNPLTFPEVMNYPYKKGISPLKIVEYTSKTSPIKSNAQYEKTDFSKNPVHLSYSSQVYKKPVRKPVYTPEPEYNIITHSEPMGPQNYEAPKQVDYIWTPYGKMSREEYTKQFPAAAKKDLAQKKADGGQVTWQIID